MSPMLNSSNECVGLHVKKKFREKDGACCDDLPVTPYRLMALRSPQSIEITACLIPNGINSSATRYAQETHGKFGLECEGKINKL